MDKMQWTISQEQYQTLVSYMGCGNFPNAKIVFFGIEEGTGGYAIPENVIARAETFGQFDNGSIVSSFTPGSREDGYWEPNAQLGGQKVRQVLGLPPVEPFTGGFFNSTIARISLALERPQPDSNHWFRLYPEDKNAAADIKRRIGQLYRKDSECRIDFALTDWRPLPRPNMGKWYPEYSTVNKSLFNKAFDNVDFKRVHQDEFSHYTNDAIKRARLLHQLITSFSIPLIIGLGKIPVKRKLLEKIFPGLQFESFQSAVFPNHPGLLGKVQLNGQMVHVLLLPFPDPSRDPWKSNNGDVRPGVFALQYYQEITNRYIKPVVEPYL
ncbi:hypothetical protein DFQ01_101446 [Paenibacillus cellulosilyticus]|uniref:Uracil DNA glycosylase superfamily protein n=1 Tax=Paenibacillus cellulosilyticus TaxID=375489 RepID=A0A2V2Z4J0_9BACL|nr:hypothetical protein [Paenibacillus cellulosilyticus]PWW08720.1 hypothetical protein DFQ01_101446 [Paenibacillus cellulosilyticus]QKS48284.1 hypothetical protein HUB94_28850 [Paenibacillus cellulosilyticus]